MIKFQLEAVTAEFVFLCQPQGIVALGTQSNLVKYLSVDFHVTGSVFLLLGICDKSTPVIQLNINMMHPAVVKQPGRISRIGAGLGNSQTFSEQQQYRKNGGQGCCADTDSVDILMIYHRVIPYSRRYRKPVPPGRRRAWPPAR